MPPKPKFTKEEVVDTALKLVSEECIEALTARELGARLGSSARPIFTVFKNMEEVNQEVKAAAIKYYDSYASKALHYTPVFKQYGMQMVLFSLEEPKLYQLLFMTENKDATDFEDVFEGLGESANICIEYIQKDYKLDLEEAHMLFRQMWIYTYGIGSLCATKMCRFSKEEISDMLSYQFLGMIKLIKSGDIDKMRQQ